MSFRRSISIALGALLAACSYNTSDFAIGDGSSGVDTRVDDSGADSFVDESIDSNSDDTVDETDDTAAAETIDASDSGVHDSGKDADVDVVDTTPFDAASCIEAGAIVCGTPPSCALTKDDPLHCASTAGCGIACDPTQYCENGSCACRPGLVACSGTCIDIAGDENHCGGCPGTLCSGGNHCGSGACSGGSCPAGRVKCGRSCWDVQGDPTHCGSTCSDIKTCNADQLCIGGACVQYEAAAGCSSVAGCDCTKFLGAGARACPALTGSSDGVPICVASTFCPTAPWN